MRAGILRATGALSLVLGFVMAMFFIIPRPLAASDVAPELVSGNPTCSDFSSLTEFKLDADDLSNGVHTDGTLVVTISNYDGQTFDWSTNFGVDAVVVKGGPNANLYSYDPLATSDTGLHAPDNPNNDQFYGISHVSFCYNPENATTTTSEAVTTTVGTTETTEAVTTTVGTTETTEAVTTTVGTIETEGTTETTEGTTETTVAATVLGLQITTSTVASSETLPFTGFGSPGVGGTGLALLLGGAGLLLLTRRRRPETDSPATGWSSRLD